MNWVSVAPGTPKTYSTPSFLSKVIRASLPLIVVIFQILFFLLLKLLFSVSETLNISMIFMVQIIVILIDQVDLKITEKAFI